MRLSFFFTFALLFVFLSINAQNKARPGNNLIIESSAPAVPILKRLEANPALCIKIYQPESKPIQFKSLGYTLNTDGWKSVDKLEFFLNGSEPLFSAKNSKVTVTPTSVKSSATIGFSLKPGWNYIWVSIVPKENALLDSRIELHVTSLTDGSDKKYPVKENKGIYKKYTGIAVRKAWDDSVHTYRIPGLTITDKGTLIGVYDIRYKHSGDLPANVDVGMSRSTDAGQTWEPMKVIMDIGAPHENNGVGDPAVLFDPVTRKIWVAALWSKGNRSIAGSEPGLSPDTTGQLVLVSSDDDGLTWSEPVSITNQVKDPKWHLYFNGPGAGMVMENGTLVFASQYWDESRKPGLPHSSIIYSDDHGKTWKSGTGAKPNTTEAQVVETVPGTLMLNMRDNRGSFRSVATTNDLGKTWTEHITSYNTLADPVCMASLIKGAVNVKGMKRDVLFFSNVNTATARMNITIKGSLDLGETWSGRNELLIDERPSFGYSALTRIDENTIGILYEGVRDLYFLRIPVKDILK